jgi:hypothetical protein
LYSPKIPERLIPELFRLARARRQPMTVLVVRYFHETSIEEAVTPDDAAQRGCDEE